MAAECHEVSSPALVCRGFTMGRATADFYPNCSLETLSIRSARSALITSSSFAKLRMVTCTSSPSAIVPKCAVPDVLEIKV